MGFEVFIGNARAVQGATPAVRVAGKQLSLNMAARELLNHPQQIVLLHDGRRMALRGATPDDSHDARCSMRSGQQVSCAKFLRTHQIPRGLYLGVLEDGLLVIDPTESVQ